MTDDGNMVYWVNRTVLAGLGIGALVAGAVLYALPREPSGPSGYVTAQSAGRGGNVIAFHGFREEPGMGRLKLHVEAADWKWGTDVTSMLATVLTTRRAAGTKLALSPAAARPRVTPESLTAALRDDSAGWRAWSDAARTAGSLFNEGAPSTIYESLQDPLSRRLRQHEGGETWSAFAHATPFAFALASLRKFASLDSHLALVAKRARAARSSGSADAPEWSLYQCELTQMVTVFGHPQAVRPLADSLRESKAEQMLVEAPEWFGCLAALSWDSGVERRLGAWLSPDGKLPEKTDFAELATALGRHALASETLRKHVLWGLSNTARQDGQTLRICDLYANALEALSGAPRAREGSAQLKRWLESQPLRPPREPEPLLP